MKLLVTGGMGFIGSNLIRMILSKHTDHVINVDKLGLGSNLTNLKGFEKEEKYKFIKGNTTDFELVSKLVKVVDAIVNVAAETHVDRSIADPLPFLHSNAIGTFNILEAIRRFNDDAKLVQVSSDEVYGDMLNGSAQETDFLNPSSPYSASKAAADSFCSAYHRTYGLNIVTTRCTNNFGPYQFPEKFIPKAIIRAIKDLKIPIYGSGKNVRDWIYVLDHCEALDLVLRKGRSGEIYNISSGNELKNTYVIEKMLQIMSKPKDLITFVEDRPGHDQRDSLNSSKLRRELGWNPRYDFKDALRLTVKWYLENERWWLPVDEKTLHQTPWKIK